jgi:membrane protease YdiL (CAAX protease family)
LPYAVILAAPAAVALARIAVQLLRGGSVFLPEPLSRPALLAVLLLQLLLFGPVSEELGWRGFALDRLLARYGAFGASFALGVAHAAWHLPLFFVPGTIQQLWGNPLPSFAVFALGIIAGTFVFTWLHRATQGSIWAAIAYHLTANLGTSLVWMSFGGDLLDRLVAALVTVVVAAGLAAASRGRPRA